VAVITEAAIRDLAATKGRNAPITSCYLDVDGRRLARHRDLEHEVEVLLKGARRRADGDRSVMRDLRRIEEYVRNGLDRSRVRGVAIFACDADGLWEVVELPVPVRTRVVVNHTPAVGQLETVMQEHESIGVLLADRQRARMFVFEMGELVERSELFDELPREIDGRGERDRGGDHATTIEARNAHHVRTAAHVSFTVWGQHPFAHRALAAPDDLASQLENALHPYLRERLCGRIAVPITAGHEQVLKAAQQVESDVERAREARIVDKLREAVAAGRRGVAGLADSVEALGEHRVDTLLVSEGYRAPGWRCEHCNRLAAMGRRCRICGQDMVEVEDLVEDAVEEALAQSCQVEICIGNADLDVMGRAGALLRY
jgi:peptide subunit release factor 1 (eRF1)